MHILGEISETKTQVMIYGGPNDGMLYWIVPGQRTICIPLLDCPFRVGIHPGREAVYRVVGGNAHYVGTRNATGDKKL